MKKFIVVIAALASTLVFAQEIGTEITPATPPPSGPQEPAPAQDPMTSAPRAAAPDAKLSAGSGAFGIRAGFGGNLNGATATGATSAGIAVFFSDNFKFLADLNVGLTASDAGAQFGFGVGLGFDLLFRKPTDALRPLFHVGVSFADPDVAGSAVAMGLHAGFGAEYFFSPNFSLNANLGLAFPFLITGGGFAFSVVTFTPGIGGTFYL